MPRKQSIKMLYMADRSKLLETVEILLDSGFEISTIAPLKGFADPRMSGMAVTDWLIIYRLPKIGEA